MPWSTTHYGSFFLTRVLFSPKSLNQWWLGRLSPHNLPKVFHSKSGEYLQLLPQFWSKDPPRNSHNSQIMRILKIHHMSTYNTYTTYIHAYKCYIYIYLCIYIYLYNYIYIYIFYIPFFWGLAGGCCQLLPQYFCKMLVGIHNKGSVPSIFWRVFLFHGNLRELPPNATL